MKLAKELTQQQFKEILINVFNMGHAIETINTRDFVEDINKLLSQHYIKKSNKI